MQTIQIADGCSQITSGATPSRKKPEYFIGDIPWLKTKELNDALIGATEEHISESALAETSCKLIPSGAVVIAMYGATVGKLGILGTPMTTNQACCAMVADEVSLHSQYLFYWLLQNRQSIINLSNGAAQQNLSVRTIKNIALKIPTLEKQIHTANALKSLDDKISTNVRIINAIDSLVDVLYSRVSKKPTEQSFAEVVQVFGGSTPSTKNDAFWDGDINWATPTDITALDGPWIGDTSRKITEAGLASMSSSLHPENSILLTSRATIGAIALASGPIATNQGFIVVEAPDELTPWLFAQMKARKREFEAWANGATFMELSRGNFKKLPFIGCSDDDLQAFNEAAWPLLKRAQAAQKENEVLARTRDELLPLLMSGRITVGEAEDAADEAASES
ncbi:restriction endonuclease subunit S [Corynebacterium striatum]